MTLSALIFVDRPCDDDTARPRALLNVGGLSLLERQLRQLRDAGIERVRIVSRDFPELLFKTIPRFRRVPDDISVVDGNMPADPAVLTGEGADALVVEDGILIDDRVIAEILESAEGEDGAIALFPPRAVTFGQGAGSRIHVDGEDRLFASVAVIPHDVVRTILTADLPQEPLQDLLEEAMLAGPPAIVDISEIETYQPNRRRVVPVLWRPVTAESERSRSTNVLLRMAQKGVLDWPARWIHPLFEDMCVRLVLPTFITPNMITLLTALLGGGIAYLFAVGQMGLALAGAMAIGVLDGVDGKLARVKRQSTKVGEMEHLLDKVVEYAWYFAIAYHLTEVTGVSGLKAAPWVLAIVIVGFSWAEGVQGEVFRRMTLKQLDDAGEFERRFRIIGARRNTIIWAWIPFALTEQWLAGFWMAAIYTLVTFFVAQWRFIVRIREYALRHGSAIGNNIRETEYF